MGQVSRAAEISQLLDPQVEKAYSQGLADHLKRSREAECQSSWLEGQCSYRACYTRAV